MKASLYRGQCVTLYRGQSLSGAMVSHARRIWQSGDDRIVFSARSVPSELFAGYRFADGQESGTLTPPMISPDASRASIGGISSSGSVGFGNGVYVRNSDGSRCLIWCGDDVDGTGPKR